MNNYEHRASSIKNPTLAHFRHFRHFSSLLTIFPLYICRDTFTNVVSALQIELFMQNKANFKKAKSNVNYLLKRNYDTMDTWSIRKNEPKTNPNEPKTNPILANKTPIRTQTNPKRTQSPAGSSAARKKSISCARQLVREYKDSPIKSLPKITENILNVEKKSHKEEKSKLD